MRATPQKKVQVWCFRESSGPGLEVLVLKTNERRGFFWQPVTGSVDAGEAYEAAAIREVAEETGCQGSIRDLIPLGPAIPFNSQRGPVLERPYALPWSGAIPVKLDPSEHVAFRWEAPSTARSLLKFESNAAVLDLLVGILKKGR